MSSSSMFLCCRCYSDLRIVMSHIHTDVFGYTNGQGDGDELWLQRHRGAREGDAVQQPDCGRRRWLILWSQPNPRSRWRNSRCQVSHPCYPVPYVHPFKQCIECSCFPDLMHRFGHFTEQEHSARGLCSKAQHSTTHSWLGCCLHFRFQQRLTKSLCVLTLEGDCEAPVDLQLLLDDCYLSC